MKKGKNVKVGIVVALLLLVVGYAVVSATLNLNGTAKFIADEDEFDRNIRFVADTDADKHATITSSIEGKTGTVEVVDEGKTLKFTTPVMSVLNETATVNYYVENVGQYDAKLGTITCTPTADNEALLDFITVTPSSNYKDLELAHATSSGATQTENAANVEVKLSKVYAEETEAKVTISCTLKAESVQK